MIKTIAGNLVILEPIAHPLARSAIPAVTAVWRILRERYPAADDVVFMVGPTSVGAWKPDDVVDVLNHNGSVSAWQIARADGEVVGVIAAAARESITYIGAPGIEAQLKVHPAELEPRIVLTRRDAAYVMLPATEDSPSLLFRMTFPRRMVKGGDA